MKIEKLYKLTLNDDYTDNDKMVFKYAFDMLFDIGRNYIKKGVEKWICRLLIALILQENAADSLKQI